MNSPVEDLTSTDMRCNVGADSGASTSTYEVAAGSSVGFKADQAAFHPGPAGIYLGQVPEGETAATWDGSGANWFKIYELGADIGDGTFTFPTDIDTYETTIPSTVPAGDYLLRMEHVGLHSAGAPQFYISCAQLTVTGGGSANPAKVEIPGYIAADDESVSLNIYYPVPTSYDCPGPEVFTDGTTGGATSAASSAPAATSSVAATSVAQSSAAETSAAATSVVESSAAAPSSSAPATSAVESSAAATSVAESSAAATTAAETSAAATSAVETSAAAPTTSAAATSAAPSSSAAAPATSAPASGNTYNDCWNAYNKCAAAANSAPNNGGAVDFSACETERATCLSGIARRMHRRKALRA